MREAIKLDPDHADAHATLGAVLSIKGDLAGSEREFREAMDSAGAAKALSAALRLKPTHTDARPQLTAAMSGLKPKQRSAGGTKASFI